MKNVEKYKNPQKRLKYKRECSKRWREQNPEESLERARKYREKNPGKVRKRIKRWQKENPEKYKIYRKNQRARRRGAIGSHTLEQWQTLKNKFNDCCAICGRQEPFTDLWYQKLTEDHIKPISKGGSNYIENIQPLCIKCNDKKYNKYGDNSVD